MTGWMALAQPRPTPKRLCRVSDFGRLIHVDSVAVLPAAVGWVVLPCLSPDRRTSARPRPGIQRAYAVTYKDMARELQAAVELRPSPTSTGTPTFRRARWSEGTRRRVCYPSACHS
jgi:hypothetical protein